MKLHPDDLDVTSFITGPEQDEIAAVTTTNDPTAATFCRICPERTTDCPTE